MKRTASGSTVTAMAAASANATAKAFKALHRPGRPLVLANVYDRLTAQAVGELPACHALATASYAVARAHGVDDADLSLDANLAAVRPVAEVARALGKPLTVDLQDGYGGRLEEAVGRLLDLGVAGVNLEDVDKYTGALLPASTAAQRIERVLAVAVARGVPDFVVNARCDVLVHGGRLDEVLERGGRYLAAGATTVFVWGAARGVARDEVEAMVRAFDGRLNVILKRTPEGLTVQELAKLGVARISVGPALQFAAMAFYKAEAEKILATQSG